MAMVKLGHHGLRKLPEVSESAQIPIYKLRNRYGGIWEKIKIFDFFAFWNILAPMYQMCQICRLVGLVFRPSITILALRMLNGEVLECI